MNCDFCSEPITQYNRIIYLDHSLCRLCAGEKVKEAMLRDDRAIMYLDESSDTWFVTDFLSVVRFPVLKRTKGHHNIAGTRIDVWFEFGGAIWHGKHYGNNNTLLHCKRTKKKESDLFPVNKLVAVYGPLELYRK